MLIIEKKKFIKIIVSMELMENIIFLFIQHESNCWYSAKKKKKNQHLARLSLSFSSQLSMNPCSYICVCVHTYSSRKVSGHLMIHRFFQMLPCLYVAVGPIEYFFPIYTAFLPIQFQLGYWQ